MTISVVTNQDASFYPNLGPFLARRAVHAEIGYPIYDDDGKEWLVAAERGKVAGFCYRQKVGKSWHVGRCYVVAEERRKGLFVALLDRATEGLMGTVVMTTCSEVMRGVLERRGFVARRQRGKFMEYAKEFGK
jgi:hypothetical protein